jgi:XTP/dITP diphosphohydrolase
MMKQICFATTNDGKFREAEAILQLSLERVKIEVPEIQSMNPHEIIGPKVTAAYRKLGRPVIVEDAGLYIEAWNGFPGPFVRHMAGTMGYAELTRALPKDNRRATWRVLYAYADGLTIKIVESSVRGTIADEPRGENGWGFDPVFIPEGDTRTYAEMGEDKYKNSARANALRELYAYLQYTKVVHE